ncbi:hypothetical protein P3L10_015407 [Capsicum annuum]
MDMVGPLPLTYSQVGEAKRNFIPQWAPICWIKVDRVLGEAKHKVNHLILLSPSINSLVNPINNTIKVKGFRVEELPGVLWAYRTTIKFIIEHEIEAWIPIEVGKLVNLNLKIKKEENNKALIRSLVMLKEC